MTTIAAKTPRPFFRRAAAIIAVAATAFLAACESMGVGTSPVPPPPEIGLYELRTYTATEGKMSQLDARFRNHTIGLFRKHGMTPIGFFHVQPLAGQPSDNRLIYILGYKDRAARDNAWRAFAADPEWTSAYAASEANGPLLTKAPENVFLTPTDYSPKLNMSGAGAQRFWELRTYTANPGKLELLHNRFRNNTLRIFAKHGMGSFLYWRPTGGQPGWENRMVYLLDFPSKAQRDSAWAAFSADEEWKKVAADSQKNGPLLISPGGVVSVQLVPTDYSPLK
ncbi:MAG TPA: NIPSNAP family protein [Hyphomonadaceae bacterium]|nr:NIPSNAP family protein [Hyphomonadaceae bacterium]